MQATQAEAGYQRGEGKICGKCVNYIHGPHEAAATCVEVAGPISPFGTCKYWSRMPNPFGVLTGEARVALHQRIIKKIRKQR